MPVIYVQDGISNLAGTSGQISLSATGVNALAGANNITLSLADPLTGIGSARFSNPIVTAPTPGTGITVNNPGEVRTQTWKATFTFAAFSAAAKTADLTIFTLPAKAKILHIIADVTTAFTGGGESAATLKVGSSAGAVDVLASADVFTAAVTLGLTDAQMGSALTRAAAIQGGFLPSWSASTAINARITTTTNNTSGLTAGSVTFYVMVEVQP